jgi:hypothetical protein
MPRARRCAWLVVLGVLLPAGSADAAGVIRSGGGAGPATIQPIVDQFRADLGGANNGVGGAFLSGRREINWDGVPDAFAEPNTLPFDFFNVNSPRGVAFESVANIGGPHQFRVSANAGNATATAVRFGNLDPTYSTLFQTFTAERLFAPRFANTLNIFFYVPGTSIPATVAGFGAVFADSDGANTYVEYYGADGKKLSGSGVSAASNGLSFLGTSFNAGERVAHVQMRLGNANLQAGNVDGTAGIDVVALDDFIYGEPQADPSVFRFADAQVNGVEGGVATVSVVRTGRGPGSVDLATSDGSATAGSDYTGVSQTLTFGLDETVKTVTVPLAKDGATEGDETVKLALSSPSGGTVGGLADATLTIIDRPPAPTTVTPTAILSAAKAKPDRLTLKLGKSRDAKAPHTFTVSGRLVLANLEGSLTAACRGNVKLAAKAGKRRLAARTVALRLKDGACEYAGALTISAKARRTAKTAAITASFAGNAGLLAADAKSSTARLT